MMDPRFALDRRTLRAVQALMVAALGGLSTYGIGT